MKSGSRGSSNDLSKKMNRNGVSGIRQDLKTISADSELGSVWIYVEVSLYRDRQDIGT